MVPVAMRIEVVSSHPLLIRAVEKTLGLAKGFRALVSVSSGDEPAHEFSSPLLFILDACSVKSDLGPLTSKYRAHAPGSKFLALLAPSAKAHEDEMRLFNWGIDGFVELHNSWQRELLHAIDAIQQGRIWVNPEVLLAFVAQARALLDRQLAHGQFLTAREGEVAQLLMRRFANKEISAALGISERTVKFHVSNVLNKLQLDDRGDLSLGKPAPQEFPA